MTEPQTPTSAPISAPEVQISRDLVRRGLIVAPLVLAVAGVAAGVHGALSAAFAMGLVLFNFLLAAWLISVTAPISLSLMMGVILGGYILRLALITLAVFAVRHTGWISIPTLGVTIIVTHLGLLVWELKYIAASLAFPGLAPNAQQWHAPGDAE